VHELSIAMGIIDVAAEELDRHGGGTVVAVYLKVGALSGVVKSALQSAFELAREGSLLERSSLLIEDVPVTVFCAECRCERPVESLQDMCCQACGTHGANIVAGRELEIVAMEIES